jgi:hypothetical protein
MLSALAPLLALAGHQDATTASCTPLPGEVNGACLTLPGGVSHVFEVFAVVAVIIFAFNLLCLIKVVTKAGYSGWWVLTAFVPIINLVMFLAFTFGKWPIQERLERAERGGSRSFSSPQFVPGPPAAPAWAPPVAPPASMGTAPGPPLAQPVTVPPSAAPPVQPAPPSQVIYCSWCGKERAVDAQAIHHCGSRERPPAYCMRCGTPLEAGAPSCASCGTPSTQLSR